MKISDWIIVGILMLLSMGIFSVVTAGNSVATIAELTAGRWTAEQAYFVTSPAGAEYACKLDLYNPDLAPSEVALTCVTWEGEAKYIGHKDGELELIKLSS